MCLERMNKTTKNVSQDNRSPDRDLNLGLTEYEAGVLTYSPTILDEKGKGGLTDHVDGVRRLRNAAASGPIFHHPGDI
jgi:hypothetical protein